MGYSHHTEQWLPCPVEAVFAFFADPDNIPALLPARQQVRIEELSLVPPLDSANPGTTTHAGNGSRLTLSFRPFLYCPLRLHWEAEVTEFSWNSRFCYRQVRGPFTRWCHYHRLRSVDRQGMDMTLIVEHAEYELPLGFLGRLAHRLFLRRQIEDMFSFRQSQLAQVFAQIPPGSQRLHQQQQRSA
jgi:ligand-binding SRPBCC domain-containing protein